MTTAAPVRRRAVAPPQPTGDAGALVVGGDYQGLGILRSLARHGVPVDVIDDELSIARFSRYTRRSTRVRRLRAEDVIVQSLLDAARRDRLGGAVLYPTREEVVAAVSRHRDVLSEVFRVPTPAWDVVRHLWDKRNTYRMADSLGIAIPRTWYPRTSADLDEVEGDGPFVVKPAVKEHFVYATGDKAWRADGRDALRSRFAAAAALVPAGEVMVQELVPGDGRQQLACCVLFKNGASLASMVACRRRQHPVEFGRASTYVETVDVPELEVTAQRLLSAVGYYGLAELEFKLDPRDGVHKLLDVNARTWGYHSLGAAAGVDFSYLLYADQLGHEVTPVRARSGVRWVRVLTDVPTAAIELRRGRLAWRDYVRSMRSVDTEAVFCRDDPLPSLVELGLLPYLMVTRGF